MILTVNTTPRFSRIILNGLKRAKHRFLFAIWSKLYIHVNLGLLIDLTVVSEEVWNNQLISNSYKHPQTRSNKYKRPLNHFRFSSKIHNIGQAF